LFDDAAAGEKGWLPQFSGDIVTVTVIYMHELGDLP
jgi:hypothetical protein